MSSYTETDEENVNFFKGGNIAISTRVETF